MYRQYYKRFSNNSISTRIENIMLSKQVENVLNLSHELINVVEKIQDETIELNEQIHMVRDIESLPMEYRYNYDVKERLSSVTDDEDNQTSNNENG